jgi:hypothetical protein
MTDDFHPLCHTCRTPHDPDEDCDLAEREHGPGYRLYRALRVLDIDTKKPEEKP